MINDANDDVNEEEDEEEVEPDPEPIVQMEFADVMNTEESSSDTGESTQDKEDERNNTADNDETGKSQKVKRYRRIVFRYR